jgi:hypothetical protein
MHPNGHDVKLSKKVDVDGRKQRYVAPAGA